MSEHEYEYEVRDNYALSPRECETQLNLYGKAGWRLVTIAHGARYIYERESS